jgi:hypothetical protein
MASKHQNSSAPIRAKQHYRYLSIAKKERHHAECNMKKMQAAGEEHSALVYKVRIKALDHYIKHLQNVKHSCENF